MKILKLLFIAAFVILLGAFGYFAFVDVPVEQSMVSKEIPNERFFDE